jgi:hypothetical protein
VSCIATEYKRRYPPEWDEVRKLMHDRSGGQCECEGECGLHRERPGPRRCTERHRTKAQYAAGIVRLTIAHLNHTPEDCRPENLKAMCQRCHLRYDTDHHLQTRRAHDRRVQEEAGQGTLL